MIKTSTGFAEQSKKTNTLYKPMILYNGKQIPDEVQDFVYEGTVADSASFSFGTACSQKCSFSINNPTENLTGKELEVKYGTMVNGQMEYIRLGYFTCLKPEIDRGVANYTLMDRMSVKMGMPYFPTVKAPTTDIDILKDICKQSGVALSSKALGKSHTVSSIPNGYTYREMLCYIAQMQGCNAVINSDGEVELRWYASVDYVLDDAHIYANGAAHVDAETPFSVGYVACIVRDPSGKKEDIELRSGTGAAGITLENPMMTQAILDDVYSRVSKMSFYPAEFEFCGDFRLELGDIVSVVTGGENYNVAVMEITHKCSYGLVTTISSVAQTDAEDGLDQQSPVTKEMDRYYANLVTINKALINKLDVETAKITYATIKDLQAETAKIDKLEADKITVDQLDANYARIDKANIGTGWIDSAMIGEGVVGTVQIADGSITDAKIVGMTANKITAGRIDASDIEVVNLKAANITVGKINGKQIEDGAIGMDNLGSDVKSSLGDIQSNVSDALKEAGIANAGVSDLKKSVEKNVKDLQSQIDGAVNTWTGAYVPTTTNYPASEWRTDAVRATHIGDIYYIEEGAENAGYAYRYQQNSVGAYGWVLLKDSDVTKAVQDAAEANKTAEAASTNASNALSKVDKSIASSVLEYYKSTSSSALSGGAWSTDMPEWQEGFYIWSRQKTTSIDGKTITYSEAACITGNTGAKGDTGKNGATGRGIKSYAVTYQASASGTTVPTGTWHTSVPKTTAEAPYLWTRTIYTYTDGTESTAYSVGSTPEGVVVGGRNLLPKSHSEPVTYSYPEEGNYVDCFVTKTITSLNGEFYTLSFWAKGSEEKNAVNVFFYNPSNVISWVNSQGKSGTYIDGNCIFELTTTWVKYWVTYKIPAGGNKKRSVIVPRLYKTGYADGYKRSGTVTIQWEKLEEGNKATDWTPAPEDTDGKIAEADKKAEKATEIANGKNTAYYSASQPTGGTYMTNDMWYDTNDGYRMYYWSGKAWTAAQYGTNAIAEGSITTALLNAEAVTAGKIAAGAVSADKIAANAVTADKILASAVTAAKIATNAVEADKIKAGAITAEKIATNAVDTGSLKASCVTTEKISTGAITTGLLAANAVTAEKIVAEAITAREIATNAITSNKILAGAVTADKIDVANLFAQEATATNLTITGGSTLNDVTAKNLTVTGDSSFEGDIVAKTLKLLQDGLTFDFGGNTNGLKIQYTNPDNSEEWARFFVGDDGFDFTRQNSLGSIMLRTVKNSSWLNLGNTGGLTSISGKQLALQGTDNILLGSQETKRAGMKVNPNSLSLWGGSGGTTIDGAKMSDKSSKPTYKRDVSGEWVRVTMRFPDIKVQISWMYYGVSQVINTAWGSGFESAVIDMGQWNQSFNSLQATYYSVNSDESKTTDCWLTNYRAATKNQAGKYYINRQTAISESRKYWIYVMGIGTYE
nr:MAG TPA: tail protein [Caudoviricetes sp.]